jgi:hypothetical protein
MQSGAQKFYSRSHDAVIRVYDAAGNVIETHEHKGDHFVIAVWRAKRIHEQEFVECYEEVCCRIYRHVRARLCWNSQSINNPPFRQIGVARRRDFPKIKR